MNEVINIKDYQRKNRPNLLIPQDEIEDIIVETLKKELEPLTKEIEELTQEIAELVKKLEK